jgi:hypothetical protein
LNKINDPNNSGVQGGSTVSQSATANQQGAFPTLTEVMSVPRYSSAELPDTLTEVDWTQLALRVRENVLERLMRRSEVMLDAQLKSTLETITARAAESLAVEMHDSLSQLVRDIVARAVNEELTRLQTEIQRRQG